MTLPASGTINLGAIQTEFGGSNPIGLGEYYRGGTYVPPLIINAGIPTSSGINLADFYSAGSDIDMDPGYVIIASAVSPTPAFCTLTCYNNGNLYGTTLLGNYFTDTWVSSTAAPGNWYQAYLEVISGNSPNTGDSINTWLDLSSNRSWGFNQAGDGTPSGVWRLHIRNKATAVTKDYTDITWSAIVAGK